MKKILPALLVVAVLVTVGITIGMRNSAQANGVINNLVVDVAPTFSTTNVSNCDLEQGHQFYQELDVYEEGQFGVGAPIGVFHVDAVKTEPAGMCGDRAHRAFRIFDKGDIYVEALDKPGPAPGVLGECIGVIIGGNGDFQGATGDMPNPIIISNNPIVIRLEFRFHQVTPVGGATSFFTPGSDSSALGIALVVSGIAVSVALFAAGSRYSRKRQQG